MRASFWLGLGSVGTLLTGCAVSFPDYAQGNLGGSSGTSSSSAGGQCTPDDLSLCLGNVCAPATCQAGRCANEPDPGQNGVPCGGGASVCQDGVCVGCKSADECPGTPTYCLDIVCNLEMGGVCETHFLNDGSDLPAASQTASDCKKQVCSAGVVTAVADDDPEDDGNDCTQDTCVDGHLHDAVADDTECGSPAGCPLASESKAASRCVAGQCQEGAVTRCSPMACMDGACLSACSGDGQCAANYQCELTPGPKQNTCVECTQNSGCVDTPLAPNCDKDTTSPLFDTCVGCSDAFQCLGDVHGTICLPSTSTCGCTANRDCLSGTCNLSTFVCQ